MTSWWALRFGTRDLLWLCLVVSLFMVRTVETNTAHLDQLSLRLELARSEGSAIAYKKSHDAIRDFLWEEYFSE